MLSRLLAAAARMFIVEVLNVIMAVNVFFVSSVLIGTIQVKALRRHSPL